MKTLSDLKRVMVKGSKWEAVHFNGNHLGIREVVEVYTNKIGFKMDNGRVSYVYFPKAKDINFNNGWVEFWREWYVSDSLEYIPILKYRQIEA